MKGLHFEWDPQKALLNISNHAVTFDEASTAFADPLSQTIYDPLHSEYEDRYVLIGRSVTNRLLVVVHTERGNSIRIISARPATNNERIKYENNEE